MGEMNVEIIINGLIKIYPPRTRALRGISTEIHPKGKIISIIGPNGAGKTTLVRILSTQLMPTSGSVTIGGYDIIKGAKKIREHIASLPQNLTPFLYTTTSFDYITTYLQVRGLKKRDSFERCAKILDELKMEEYMNVEVGKLSGGNLRKIFLAMILSADVDLYFLDEPTTGLDPISRQHIWAYLNKLIKKYNKSIILTSHYMDEIAMLSNEVLIISKGRLMNRGDPKTLIKNIIGNLKYKIVIKEERGNKIMDVLSEIRRNIIKYHVFGDIYYLYPEDFSYMTEILSKFSIKYEVVPIGLDDVFFEVSKNDANSSKSIN